MALTEERAGQIAMIALQMKMEEGGIRLIPKEIKRDMINEAKKLGISAPELAQFVKIAITKAFNKTIAELDSIK